MHQFESNYHQIGRTSIAMETCGARIAAMCPRMTKSLFYSLQSKKKNTKDPEASLTNHRIVVMGSAFVRFCLSRFMKIFEAFSYYEY